MHKVNVFPFKFPANLIMAAFKKWFRNVFRKRKPFRKFHAGTLLLK